MINVTTSTGRTVSISVNSTNTGIVANIGNVGPHSNVTFGVVETADGFSSRFAVAEAGNKVLSVILSGADLAACKAMFANLHADITASHDDDAAYEARRDRILRAMEG